MATRDTRNDDIKDAILGVLTERLPNNVRIRKVREILSKTVTFDLTSEQVDKALDDLISDGLVKIESRDRGNQRSAVRRALQRREAISLVDPPDAPVKGEYVIGGDTEVVRMLGGDIVSAEDLNEVTEALKEYIERIDKTFDERVQRKTAEIYKQMIGIFGVFVSIFSVIVISTDKMLRFNPDVLKQDWWILLLKSSALFLPVGIVIGGLIWILLRGIKK